MLIVVSVIVVVVVVPEYCQATQTSNARKFPLHDAKLGWLADVYVRRVAVEEATLVAVSQLLHKSVAVVQLSVGHIQAVTK